MTKLNVNTPRLISWQKFQPDDDAAGIANLATPLRLRQIIIAAIRAGDLSPGTRLKEIDLVEALAVSRTPLREALTALRAEGILERDDDGLRVRRLDWRDVRALYDLRGQLESMAARLAANNAFSAERAVIDEICRDESRLISQSAPPNELARQNRRFHHAILQAAGNRFLSESLERLSQLMVLLGATAYSLDGRADAIRDEHAAINVAIQTGDAEGAEAAMLTHLETALTARLRLLSLTDDAEMD